MTENEFWRLTPAQFFALVEQANKDVQRADKRSGYLIALIHNMFVKKSDRKEPDFWFPSLSPKKSQRKRGALSKEEEVLKQKIAAAHLERADSYGKKGRY